LVVIRTDHEVMIATLRRAVVGEEMRTQRPLTRQPTVGGHGLLALQRAAGNQAVAAYVQRACCVSSAQGRACDGATRDPQDTDVAVQHMVAGPQEPLRAPRSLNIQRDDEGDGGLAVVNREIAALRATFSGARAAALSVVDAQALDAALAELRRTAGFEQVRPLGLRPEADAAPTAAVPVPLPWPVVVELLETIAAAVAAASLWELLLVLALLLAILLLLRKALEGPVPVPAPVPTTTPVSTTEPTTGNEGDPEKGPNKKKGPGPTVGPPPSPPNACSPTGLTRADPIPMTWFKPMVDDYYPGRLRIQGYDYDRDTMDHLPHGEPIGIAPQYVPSLGKIMQLLPTDRGSGADRFRAVLLGYGFDWTGLQADHVQDLEFEGDDSFENLWPMDQSANLSAGARTNQQVVGVCLTPNGSYVTYTLQQLKAAGLYGRYFQIRNVSR
jgi:hypothetical protein